MKKLIPLVAVAAVAAGAYVWQARTTSQPNTTELLPFGAANAQEAEAGEVDTSIVHEMVLGAEDAPITVIEYASATCPHCKNFHLGTFKEVKANYIDTGKVKFVYREVYFDRFGLWAAMVARCGIPAEATPEELEAGSKRYFGIMDLVFAQQAEWTASDSPAGIAENLATIGKTAGLGADQVDACLQDADFARALITVYEENRAADGVQSTPTFIIDGEKVTGDTGYDEFAAKLDEKLGE